MAKAIDSFENDKLIANEPALKADGVAAIACYYFNTSGFKQLLTRAVATALSKDFWLISVWESGQPTSGDYFTRVKGKLDGAAAVKRALAAGQPKGTVIYAAVDYDASASDLTGIRAYFEAFQAELAAAGYLTGVYGSGRVCAFLKGAGLVTKTWLTQSKGFAGYQTWLPCADIVQGAEKTIHTIDADLDETNGAAGGWKVTL